MDWFVVRKFCDDEIFVNFCMWEIFGRFVRVFGCEDVVRYKKCVILFIYFDYVLNKFLINIKYWNIFKNNNNFVISCCRCILYVVLIYEFVRM